MRGRVGLHEPEAAAVTALHGDSAESFLQRLGIGGFLKFVPKLRQFFGGFRFRHGDLLARAAGDRVATVCVLDQKVQAVDFTFGHCCWEVGFSESVGYGDHETATDATKQKRKRKKKKKKKKKQQQQQRKKKENWKEKRKSSGAKLKFRIFELNQSAPTHARTHASRLPRASGTPQENLSGGGTAGGRIFIHSFIPAAFESIVAGSTRAFTRVKRTFELVPFQAHTHAGRHNERTGKC